MKKIALLAGLGVLCTFFVPGETIVSDATFENCEFLGNNRLKVSWTLRSSAGEIDFQLCGCNTGDDIDSIEYMGFGLSGSDTVTLMRGADPTIAYVDDNTGPVAVDYYLSDYVQCGEGNGACPDTLDSNACTDDVRNVTGFKREGLQCVSYTRSLASDDATCDTPFNPDVPQYIVWGVGGVGATAFKHFRRAASGDAPITFGRDPSDMCSSAGGLICPNCPPFVETVMDASGMDTTFVANIGPPGNERGYMAIADQAGWGIAWYINGTLIPRLVVERGYTYTFISEGGQEGEGQSYHPFYISDSRRGGWLRKTEAQRRAEVIFAGFDENMNPIGVGPYCPIEENSLASVILNTCGPQADYMQNLRRGTCSSSNAAGSFTWTPDENTPNTVYYQCATHTNLGYQITVIPEITPVPATTTTAAGATGVLAYTITIALMAVLTFAL